MTINPGQIQTRDRIGLICPSACCKPEHLSHLEAFIRIAEDRFGCQVELSKNFKAVDRFQQSAGTPKERADDLNDFFQRDDINAIWCFQGGNTANELLDLLNYDLIYNNPKPFIGLSDITVLLNAIFVKTGLVTFHGTDPKAGFEDWHMESEYSQSEFIETLVNGRTGAVPPFEARKEIKAGKASGQLIGGNLRCFLKLAGTDYFPDLSGRILILEGFSGDSELSEVAFNIAKLKQQKNFDKLAGVIVGKYYGFDQQQQYDNDGQQIRFEDIFCDAVSMYDFPILKSYDFGHRCPSTFLPIGGTVEFDTSSGEIATKS